MKLKTLPTGHNQGLTLIEITVVIVVLLTLISVLFVSARAYDSGARRSGCALVQDKIRKLVITESHLTDDDLQTGVDYYSVADYQHVYIEQDTKCPEEGDYTAILDEDGKLQINCTVHGNLLEELGR